MKLTLTLLLLASGAFSQILSGVISANGPTSSAGTITFSPAAGAVTNPTTVTMSTTTGCDAYIYHNTTGSVTTGDTHTTTYSVTGAVTLYAAVIGCPGHTDSTGSAAYTIAAPISLVDHKTAAAVGGAGNAATTASANCTGANFAAVLTSDYRISSYLASSDTVQDSADGGSTWSSAWTNHTNVYSSSATTTMTIWYKAVTGSSTHQFRGSGSYIAIASSCFSNVVTSPLDQQNGTSATSGTSIQIPSITPTTGNQLILAGMSYGDTTVPTINGGFTLLDHSAFLTGSNQAVALAYLIQTTAAASSPTWSNISTADYAVGQASFKNQ